MLDKRSLTLLQTINDLCPNGVYEILTTEDISEALPKRFKTKDKDLRALIEELAEKKLISIKYSDEHEFCLAPLPDGKMRCDQPSKDEPNYDAKKAIRKMGFVCFCASLIGAVVGGMIVYLLFTII